MCLPIQGQASTDGLDERILEQVFSTYWGEFERKFKEILKALPQSTKPETRSEKNLLSEILENTRFLSSRIRSLEARVEKVDTQEDDLDHRHRQGKLSAIHEMITLLEEAGMDRNVIARSLADSFGISTNSARFHMANYSKNKMRNTADKETH